MNDRIGGLLLFLPVPLVLWLFTRSPLGVPLSLGLGTALTVTHRLYARPYALRRAAHRCLWCGGRAANGVAFTLGEPLGISSWQACSADHAGRLGAFLGWTARQRLAVRLGILGTLALFLPGALLADGRHLGPLTTADAVAFFRLGIAATVLPLGWLAPRGPARSPEGIQVPFPVHIQALIGTRAVSWLFRIVGLVWLGSGLVQVAQRLGIS